MSKLNNKELNDLLDLELGKKILYPFGDDLFDEIKFEKESKEITNVNKLLESGIEAYNIEAVDLAIRHNADVNGVCRLYGPYSREEEGDIASPLYLAVEKAVLNEWAVMSDKLYPEERNNFKAHENNLSSSLTIVDTLLKNGAHANEAKGEDLLGLVASLPSMTSHGVGCKTAEILLDKNIKITNKAVYYAIKGANFQLLNHFFNSGYKATTRDLHLALQQSNQFYGEGYHPESLYNPCKKVITSIMKFNPQVVNNYKFRRGLDDYPIMQDAEIQTVKKIAEIKNRQFKTANYNDVKEGIAKTKESGYGYISRTSPTNMKKGERED